VSERERAQHVVRDWLATSELDHEDGARPGEIVVQLPGEHKLRTTVSLLVGDHSLSASAFVVRHVDENEASVHRWLLERNARLQGVAFALDALGDVYLVGRLPLPGVTPGTVDALLGALLATADSSFDGLLAMGFLTSMRREWAWRVSRGESTRNLEAFRCLLERPSPPPPARRDGGRGDE
jgi:Putative bacterial sensory transduction regulator